MSTSGKDKITDYSADYRSVHSHRPKREPKPSPASRPEPKPVHGGRAEAKPRRPEPAAPAEEPGADTEIDDFLPKQDRIDGERLLEKWEDGLESPAEAERAAGVGRRRGKRRYGIFLGTVVLLLALVGVGFIATEIGTRIHGALTDDSRLRAYDKFLTVVVAQDPQPFESPQKADPDFVLTASLWQTMTENGAGYTNYDGSGRTIVPLGDVAQACHELFGPDCSLQPKNPETETFYSYDASKYQFHVSLYSLDSTYVPYTVNRKNVGDAVVLRVGFVPPSDATRALSGVSSGGTPSPTKYMDYVLKTNQTTQKEYIYAIRKAGAR